MAQSTSTERRKPRFRERNAAKQQSPEAAPRQRPSPVVRQPGPRPRVLHAPAPRLTIETALYAAIVVGGFALRIWDIGSRAMHGDESVHAWLAWNLYSGTGYQYDPVYHGPLQFLVTALFYFLFGVSNSTARLMAVLFGTALIVLPLFLRPYMGRFAALTASAFIAFSPAFVYVSRLERDDIFTAFFALTMAISLFGFVRTGRIAFVYLGAASVALSLAAMENTYITLFVLGTYVFITVAAEMLTVSRWGPRIIAFWRSTGSRDLVSNRALATAAAVLALAFLATVLLGLYVPVPAVLWLGVALQIHRETTLRVAEENRRPVVEAFQNISRQQWFNAITIAVAILFLCFSTFGTNLRGIWDATQPFFNTGHACPGNPFILNPCRKDMIGGLFYWLSQHSVHRGGQPWFYYSLLFGLYQQIALVFGVAGIAWFARRPTQFSTFVAYWALVIFGVYSWAGEKFSWLMIHPLLPFTLIAAMFVAAVIRLPSRTRYSWLAVLALLGALELHSMFEVNYVYGADPVEMMVYVQSSPDTPKVANDILSISNKVTNGNDLHVTIDTLETWPFAWYLRDLPNVAYPAYPQLVQKSFTDNPVIIVDESNQPALYPKIAGSYSGKRYRLRWWFPEDYKALTWPVFGRDLIDPGYWKVVTQWLLERRPFGPKSAVWFYYYVKNGLVSPY